MLNGLVYSWFLKGVESMEPTGTEGSKGPSTCSDFSSTAFERKRDILGSLISAFGKHMKISGSSLARRR